MELFVALIVYEEGSMFVFPSPMTGQTNKKSCDVKSFANHGGNGTKQALAPCSDGK